ncbi:MAG: TetR/AcrR family transcriptional regulator [Acholeplasma sp.]|nr:TetR/AcrR family transcriptional regulator [Acholeplasma sp.]
MKNLGYRLPKRKDGIKTFDRILKTAKELFAKNGFSTTSINEIIEKSNIATGTFYLYFDDKLSLYKYLLGLYRIEIGSAIREGTKHASNRYEMEKLGIRAFLKFAWDDRLSYKIIWESLFIDYEIFKDYYSDFSQNYIKQLKKSREKGELIDDIDLETLSYILMGIANFVGLQVLFLDELSEEKLDFIVDNIMKVLSTGIF